MKKLYFIPAVLVVFAVVGALILMPNETETQQTSNNDATTNTTMNNGEQQAENEVFIKDFDFSPETLKIKKGTTVKWTNMDGARHDITPDQPSDMFKASELLARGESYSVTFTETGTFSYICSPHPYMKATIEVTE